MTLLNILDIDLPVGGTVDTKLATSIILAFAVLIAVLLILALSVERSRRNKKKKNAVIAKNRAPRQEGEEPPRFCVLPEKRKYFKKDSEKAIRKAS